MITRAALTALAADVAHADGMAILGEGNVSARLDDECFLVKASGTSLATLRPEHLVDVRSRPLLDAVAGDEVLDDGAMERLLLDARTDPAALKPSVESLFHAWLLQLDGVHVVAHTHPIAVDQILCSPHARAFADGRLIPDQIVYCGAASVLVPYVDPGLVLARAIAAAVTAFQAGHGVTPKTILLENHGLIALGATPGETFAALAMTEKAARIFTGAALLGGPVFLPPHHVARIAGRPDEHYRQRILSGSAKVEGRRSK